LARIRSNSSSRDNLIALGKLKKKDKEGIIERKLRGRGLIKKFRVLEGLREGVFRKHRFVSETEFYKIFELFFNF